MEIFPNPICQRIATAVNEAEKRVLRRASPEQMARRYPQQIISTMRREEVYIASDTYALYSLIERLDLNPKYHFADLGSGLGAACFTAAQHFKNVVGFEMDTPLCEEAEVVRQELGFDNVRFINQDFLDNNVDLSSFKVLYTFQPFLSDFKELMSERMRKIEPGTFVIAYVFFYLHQHLFPTDSFRLIYPTPEDKLKRPQGDFYYVYQRI
jgi:methylase of polypeptide subunit release factors